MDTVKYYLHLYKTCIARSIVSRLEFKKDLFIGIFGFLFENVASLASIYFVIRNIPSLSGWDMYQMGFLYGFTMMPIAIDHLLTDELWRVAYFRVKKGDLDRYFLRPVPILLQVLSETFQPEAFGELIVGVAMLILCGSHCKIYVSLGTVVMFLVAVFAGAVIITSLKILTAAPAFIIKRSGFIMQIIYNFRDYTRYPIGIYPKPIRIMLLFLFPFGLIISLPAEAILFADINPWSISAGILVMAILFLTLSCLVWRACVKKYESTGS